MSRHTAPEGGRPGRLGDLALYGAARTGVEGLFAVRGIALATVLGPALFGVWTLFRMALRYGAFAAMGIHRGLEVEVAAAPPGQAALVREQWGRSSAGYILSVYSALAVCVLLASLFLAPERRLTVQAIAAGLLLERLWIYGSSYLRAEGRLGRFAAVEVIHALLSLLLATALALVWGLAGAYAGFLVAMAFSIALLGRSVPYRPEFSGLRVRRLLGIGVPLSLASILNTLLATVDRLIVAGVGGVEELGLYAFAVATSGLGASAAWVVRTVVFPEVYRRAREEGGAPAAGSHLRETVLPVALLLPPLLGFVAIALGPAIELAAPAYTGVIPVARLFIFTGAAAGIMTLGTLGMVAMERQRLVPIVAASGLALNAASALGALLGGLGLIGVAAGALVSRSLTALGVVGLASGARGEFPTGSLALRLLLPTAWCAGTVALLGYLLPDPGWRSTGLFLFGYLVALAPMAPALRRAAFRVGGASERGWGA